jgi:hypothetical protein
MEDVSMEVHCGALAEGIITVVGATISDNTGWWSPIGTAHQAE